MTKTKDKVKKPAAGKVPRGEAKTHSATNLPSSGRHARRDPIEIIEQSNEGRLQALVPIRHSRMSISPFTFYRGAASVMAADLAAEVSSGVIVQCCGDCHVLNFGGFATPERNIIIDLNDFDETHPAPFEWDIKRLVASLVLAGNSIAMSSKTCQKAAFEMAQSYQIEMAKYAKARLLDIWYSKIDYQSFIDSADHELAARRRKMLNKEITKSSPESLQKKLIEECNGSWRFKEMPPLLYHAPELTIKVHEAYEQYLESLSPDRSGLLGHFDLVDVAMKVVGTGSVGTFCAVLLLVGANDDFLVLQVKEARKSVLEPYTAASKFQNSGQRVVVGQRIMQSASDMFLGWAEGARERQFFVRQLRDVKMSPNPARWNKFTMLQLSNFAGRVLAKAHAKSGEAEAIAGYIGKSDKFANSMSEFALSYADVTASDYKLFTDACQSGRLATESSIVG
ncbi:DUF2252 domain-containing protein [bacterium]|nr:DUF2252 domain-containing protein [bacterium]MBP9807645.1 DUF2252 domain-containing protein [bacterium]